MRLTGFQACHFSVSTNNDGGTYLLSFVTPKGEQLQQRAARRAVTTTTYVADRVRPDTAGKVAVAHAQSFRQKRVWPADVHHVWTRVLRLSRKDMQKNKVRGFEHSATVTHKSYSMIKLHHPSEWAWTKYQQSLKAKSHIAFRGQHFTAMKFTCHMGSQF